jgi:hypothetical protein
MRLTGVELVRVEIPFLAEIGTAAGTHRNRSLLFVRVATAEEEGWGECAAMSEGTLVDPTVHEVVLAVEGRGVPRLIEASRARGGHLPVGNEIAQLFGGSAIDRMVGATFEMAVLDAGLRSAGRSLADSLGVGPDFRTMLQGTAVGIPADRDVGALLARVTDEVERGSSRVRLKIAPGWDVEPVKACARPIPNSPSKLDANGSYRMEADRDDPRAAIRLGGLADYDVLVRRATAAAGRPGGPRRVRVGALSCRSASMSRFRPRAGCSTPCATKPARWPASSRAAWAACGPTRLAHAACVPRPACPSSSGDSSKPVWAGHRQPGPGGPTGPGRGRAWSVT